ncbi:MAG: trypsin-like serine peptidase [Pseudobdellovibrio sp.]
MKLFASLLFVLVALNAQAQMGTMQPDKIIGSNDLVAVNADGSNIPAKYKNLLDAFGLMSMGCTATHIGNGIVLSAGHCFWASETMTTDQDCSDTTVDWGVRGDKKAYLTSKCEKVLFAQRDSTGSDFSIFKVSPVPSASIGVELDRKAQPGDVVTIFSHPEELPLQWSKTCVVENNSDKTLPPEALQHTCDTNPGSSGATIVDENTLKVVAIHDGGHLTGPTTGMNYGTYLTDKNIHDALKSLGF